LKNFKKFIEIDKKKVRKKVALIKTDYEEEIQQPTPAGQPQGKPLSTGLVTHHYQMPYERPTFDRKQ
jgi:hypothetical protein